MLRRYSSLVVMVIVLFSQNFLEARPVCLQYAHMSPDTILSPDSLVQIVPDSLATDTVKARSPDALDARVDYNAEDSIRFDMVEQKVFLYGNAVIVYKDIKLVADYIEIDFNKNEVYAAGLPDSTGKLAGQPIFTQGDQSFKSKVIRYNYKTEKGFINKVLTEDGTGYLHGESVKKMGDNVVNISKGSYTTCNLEEHPHFEFRYNKSKVIPQKRIVTGPAYLTIEEVPTPLLIPFGWFPTKQGQRSGIIIPTFGEVAALGFSFEGGGYYLYINDRMDLKITADFYTGGSWAIRPAYRYKKRYKYSGNFNLNLATTITGVKETPNYTKKRNFAVQWSHRQDPKARPRSNFSADVNIVTAGYNKYNSTSTQDYLSNTFRSSIAYQTNFGGKYFLTLNASHDQNTKTHLVNVTLPEVSFSVNRFNLIPSKNVVGKLKWYHNITTNYNLNARNSVSKTDSTFFEQSTIDNMQNGIKHTMPVSSTVKLLKFINWNNTLTLNDRMYFESIRKFYTTDTLISGNDTTIGYVVKDTINGFNNIFDLGFSSGLSTKIYGMVQFGKNFPVRAIRHVMTPTLNFSYNPDYTTDFWGYFDSYIDQNGREVVYSKYEGAIYGSPSQGRSTRLSFSLVNNLELKLRSRKDTITGTKKFALIDNFTISFSYDFAKDSLNWSPLSLSGRTRFFKNFDVSYRSEFDPYILDSTGTRNLAQTEWSVNKRLLRMKNYNWALSLNWRLTSNDFGKNRKTAPEKPVVPQGQAQEDEFEEIQSNPSQYIDWSIPWDLTINYSFNYGVTHRYPDMVYVRDEKIVQTLGVSGNVSITPKWKVGFITGWDFTNNDLSYTSISFYRDLHCWEMRLNWVPTGDRKSWNFSLNAKASILQDLKLTKKKDFRDF